ncbi:MAG: PHP domain-containing protein [Deltaproteobacteria bacterium]|nr:PHP domain-containing protein [Deltaproteobacteria bacterium]
MKRLDLHAHSTASDGTYEPSKLVFLAKLARLAGLALCDHDTVDGLTEFLEAGQALGFPTIGGVEVSLEYQKTTHLLGLGVGRLGGLTSLLTKYQERRLDRNRRLFEKLQGLGLELDWSRLEELSASGQMGRPHFAQHLIERGYANDIQEAFKLYLAKGSPGYVDKVRPQPEEAASMLIGAGFAPVLAHPISVGLTKSEWERRITWWKDLGLVGLEVYHPDQSTEFSHFLNSIAKKFKLVATAGSDFHGANKKTPLTWVKDNCPLGLEVLDELKMALEQL